MDFRQFSDFNSGIYGSVSGERRTFYFIIKQNMIIYSQVFAKVLKSLQRDGRL